jgi:hypothetical protein
MIPGAIIRTQTYKPTEHQIVVEPLNQLSLRPNGEEYLEQHYPYELLGWNE